MSSIRMPTITCHGPDSEHLAVAFDVPSPDGARLAVTFDVPSPDSANLAVAFDVEQLHPIHSPVAAPASLAAGDID